MVDIKDPEDEIREARLILKGIRERLAIHRTNLGIAEAYIIGLDVMITAYKQHVEHLPQGEHSVVALSEMVPISFKSIPFLGAKIDGMKMNPARAAYIHLLLAKRQARRCWRWENTAIKDETIREAYYAKLAGEPASQNASP